MHSSWSPILKALLSKVWGLLVVREGPLHMLLSITLYYIWLSAPWHLVNLWHCVPNSGFAFRLVNEFIFNMSVSCHLHLKQILLEGFHRTFFFAPVIKSSSPSRKATHSPFQAIILIIPFWKHFFSQLRMQLLFSTDCDYPCLWGWHLGSRKLNSKWKGTKQLLEQAPFLCLPKSPAAFLEGWCCWSTFYYCYNL